MTGSDQTVPDLLAAVVASDAALEALARAYDCEDSAQRGEPDPWTLDPIEPPEYEAEWWAERIVCARAGLEAALPLLSIASAFEEQRKRVEELERELDQVRAAFNRMFDSPAAPEADGWKLVPMKPTEAMINAGNAILNFTRLSPEVWTAMLAASPVSSASPAGTNEEKAR